MKIELSNVTVLLGSFRLEIDTMLDAPVTALFGPSGAGKTTLLETIAGLRRPASGHIALDGEVIFAAGQRCVAPERRGIGYVPQDGALFPHLDVRANLRYGHRRAVVGAPQLSLEKVSTALEIGPLIARRVAGLSGGERRRVALGRALLSAPRLLLLDEPLAELDIPLRERLLPLLERVRDEFAIPILYVSHSPEEVVALNSDVVALESGRVTHRGRASELFAATGAPRYEWRKPER